MILTPQLGIHNSSKRSSHDNLVLHQIQHRQDQLVQPLQLEPHLPNTPLHLLNFSLQTLELGLYIPEITHVSLRYPKHPVQIVPPY